MYGSDWFWSSNTGLGAWTFSFRVQGRVGERRGGPLQFDSNNRPSSPCLVPEIDDVLDFPKGRMRFQPQLKYVHALGMHGGGGASTRPTYSISTSLERHSRTNP